MSRETVIQDVKEELLFQDGKWGEQNHPILDQLLVKRGSAGRMAEEYEIPTENRAKQMCDIHTDRGDLTYMHILVEEVSEVAASISDVNELRKELVQVAAVAIAMIEALDRNGR